MQTNLVVALFANIAKCEQDRIIAKYSQSHKSLVSSDIFLAVDVVVAIDKTTPSFRSSTGTESVKKNPVKQPSSPEVLFEETAFSMCKVSFIDNDEATNLQ